MVVAFALRVAWAAYAEFAPTLSDDAGRYQFLGQALADGRGFINPNGNETMFWPPGYPFMLAALYKLWPAGAFGQHEVTLALVLNAALGALTCALVYAIARRAFPEPVALVGAAVTAVFPSLVFFANVTLTEVPYTFLALLGLLLIVESQARDRWWLLVPAGLIIGFAALVRGQALLLPLVAGPFWLVATRDLRASVARVAGVGALSLLVVAPWTARNYAESGSLVLLSSNAGVDFYISHSEGADGRGRKVDELVFRYPELPPMEAEARVNRDGFEEGIEWAVRHPLDEIELAARKLFYLYYRDDEGVRWTDAHGERDVFSSGGERSLWVWVSNGFYWVVMAVAVAGVTLAIRGRQTTDNRQQSVVEGQRAESKEQRRAGLAVQVLLVSVVAYWTLVHVAFFGDPRFHAPVMPVVGVFAGVAVIYATDLVARLTDERHRARFSQ